MANQNVLQLPQQSGTANTSSVLYAVTGGTTDTGLPLSVLFNSPTFTGSPTVPNYAPLAGATFTGELKARYSNAQISVDDPTSNGFCAFYWKGNAVQNWAMMFDTSTPALKLMRYNASGSFQDTPWQVNWTTGLISQLNTTFTGTTTINGTLTGTGISAYLASPPSIGSVTPATGAFTALSASSTVSGTGFSNYLASPPAIGGTAANAGSFTTLQASGNDALCYTTTNALSLPSASVVTVTTFTKVFDRVNTNFNATTGVFTAPATGIYQVQGNFSLASGTNAAGARLLAAVQVNGSTINGAGAQSYMQTATSMANSINFSSLISVTSGQTVTVVLTQNSGATRALDGTTSNWWSINRVA